MTVSFPTINGLPVFDALGLDPARANLVQASFRGVPFHAEMSDVGGGRRVVEHVFPLRDQPYLEDLGRRPRTIRMTGFVVGPLSGTLFASSAPLWNVQRDALLDALEGSDQPGTLIHPTMGAMQCRVGGVHVVEQIVEHFGAAVFTMEFLLEGDPANPSGVTDPASSLLAGVASLLPLLSAAYETVELGETSPATLLGTAVSAMSGLPATTVLGAVGMLPAIQETPFNLAATAAAVQAATQAMVTGVLAAQPAPATTDDPVAGTPFYAAPAADPSGGVVGLAQFGASLPAPANAAQSAMQAAVVALVSGNATAAVAQIYAQIAWPTQNAAEGAASSLLALIDGQIEAAASAGADDLYRGWRALYALAATYMAQVAQQLPAVITYVAGDSYPAPVLAQRLYGSAAGADALFALNDVPSPLFMPATGLALTP